MLQFTPKKKQFTPIENTDEGEVLDFTPAEPYFTPISDSEDEQEEVLQFTPIKKQFTPIKPHFTPIREGEQDTQEQLHFTPIDEEQEEIEEQEEDNRIQLIEKELKRLNAQQVFHEATSMTGYYGGCLVYLDTGANDNDLAFPLNLDPHISSEARERGFLKRLKVIDPVNVCPGTYNAVDPLANDYYQPHTWWIMGRQVHSTRFLFFRGNEVPTIFKPAYNFFGIPQAQILWDYVMHYQANRDNINRILGKSSTFVFKTNMAEIVTGGADSLSDFDARMQLIARSRSNDGILAIDKESEDIANIQSSIGGMTDVVKQSLEAVAALNRTPAVKLLGISPSGFNATGESDIRNYYDHVLSQQEKILRTPLQELINVIQVSLFGDLDETISFDFCSLSEEDNNSKAMNQQVKIGNLCNLLDHDIISPEEARKILIDDKDSGFDGLDPDEIPEPQGGEDSMEGAGAMGGGMPEIPAMNGDGGSEGKDFFAEDEHKWITVHPGRKGMKKDGSGEKGGVAWFD